MSDHVSRRQSPPAGSVRQPPHLRPPRREADAHGVHRRRQGVHRERHLFLHCHGRRRGPARLLVQGRPAGLRARHGRPSSRSRTMTATACSRASAICWSIRTSDCCSSPCTAAAPPARQRQRDGRARRSAARRDGRRAADRAGQARAIFPNCPRYIPTMQLVEPSVYAPRAGLRPVEPAWKGFDDFKDYVHPRQPTARRIPPSS